MSTASATSSLPSTASTPLRAVFTAADRPTAAQAVDSILERGYAVIPALLSEPDRLAFTALMDGLIEQGQAKDNVGTFGWSVHPLCPRSAEVCRFYTHPLLEEIYTGVFGGPAWLAHTGARMSDARHAACGPRIGWHNHARTPEFSEIQPGDPRRGTRPDRMLMGWYLDGTSTETGPLVVLPRRFNDLLAPPMGDRNVPWPGEVEVHMPPGSAVIFATDLWHAAKSGAATTGRRRLVGCHVQGKHNPLSHPEDHVQEGPEIESAKTRFPSFARLLERTPRAG